MSSDTVKSHIIEIPGVYKTASLQYQEINSKWI